MRLKLKKYKNMSIDCYVTMIYLKNFAVEVNCRTDTLQIQLLNSGRLLCNRRFPGVPWQWISLCKTQTSEYVGEILRTQRNIQTSVHPGAVSAR